MSNAIDRSPRLQTDPGAVGASLASLPLQLSAAVKQFRTLRLPRTYRGLTSIMVGGMGGSHLAADIIRSAYTTKLRVPLHIVSDYSLPAWVGPRTLVVISSYSGGTEEAIALLDAALARRAKVVVVTAGGKLARRARRWHVPLALYDPRENISHQPRLGVAYSLVAMLRIFSSLGYVPLATGELTALIAAATRAGKKYGPDMQTKSNRAKQLALRLYRHLPILIGSEWMAGNLVTWRNQLHENAKTWAETALIPELNHHLLEGLRDRTIARRLVAVMLDDARIHPRNQKRLRITSGILKKLGVRVERVRFGQSPAPAIDLLSFGGYVSWYLSILHDIDPAPIPTVDELKHRLA